MEIELVIFATGVFLAAGFIKGVVGMGLPIMSMGLLGLVMPPAEAAALMALPSLVTNVQQTFGGNPVGPIARRFSSLVIGICIGAVATTLLLPAAMGDWATALLGAILITSALLNILQVALPVRPDKEQSTAALIGATTGVLTITTGVAAVPSAIFLRAIAMPRDTFIQSLGLSFSVSNIVLIAALAYHGIYKADFFTGSVLALVPAVLGMRIGASCRRYLNPERFKLIFDTSMMIIGIIMVGKVLI